MAPRTVAVLIFGLVAASYVLLILSVPSELPPLETWTTVFDQPDSRAERLVAQMDGQAFAQHATDPLLSDFTDGYKGDQPIAAYRAARPLQGWVNWVVSLGAQRPLLAPAMMALGAACIASLALVVSAVASATGRRVRQPLLLLVASPAILATLRWPGLCEPLAAALALGGLAVWCKGRHVQGVVLFTLAALTRETSLLVPLGLALVLVWDHRRLRPALHLAIPPLVYLLWLGAVRWRVGTFPSGSAQMGAPLVGLIDAVPHWRWPEWVTFAALLGCSAITWLTGDRWLRGVVLAHVAFLAVVGELVWWFWWGFGRVTLPIFLLAFVGQKVARRRERAEASLDRHAAPAVPLTDEVG